MTRGDPEPSTTCRDATGGIPPQPASWRQGAPRIFFITSLAVHVGIYWVLIFAFYLRENGFLDSFMVDFYSTYMKAVDTFFTRPLDLYVAEDLVGTNVWVLHNLPGVVLYYMPFYFVTGECKLNLMLYSACTLGWNLLACDLLRRLPSTRRWQSLAPSMRRHSTWTIMGFYLLCPLHVPEYALGQTNAIAGLFIIAGFYFFMQGKEEFAFALVSVSLYFKLIGLPVLLLMLFTGKKNLAKNIFFAVAAQWPNIFLFLRFPTYIVDFVKLNVMTQEVLADVGYRGFGTGSSGTLSVFFTQNFGAPLASVTLVVLVATLSATVVTLVKRRGSMNAIEQWMLLILLFAVVFPLFYLVHVFLYLGLFLYWISMEDDKLSTSAKVFLAIPTFSIFFWFLFPFISFMYLFAFLALLLKPWRSKLPKGHAGHA